MLASGVCTSGGARASIRSMVGEAGAGAAWGVTGLGAAMGAVVGTVLDTVLDTVLGAVTGAATGVGCRAVTLCGLCLSGVDG